jgi:hypothetical protein
MTADVLGESDLDLPSRLTFAARDRWLAALIVEARRPNHGQLGLLVPLVGELRQQQVAWAQGRPWTEYTPVELVGVIEDFAEHHACGELAMGLDPTRSMLDDRMLRDAFPMMDDVEWAGLKWVIFVALAPLSFARVALRLDVLRPYATREILRRFEDHPPGAWAALAATASDVGDDMLTNPLGKALSAAIFPQLTYSETRAIGESAKKTLTAMAWDKTPAWVKNVIKGDAPADPDARRRRQDAEAHHAIWKALGEMRTGRSAADLYRAVLEGKLDIAARKVANRIQDATRQLKGSAPGSRHAATLSIRDAAVSLKLRDADAEQREQLAKLMDEEQARSRHTLEIVGETQRELQRSAEADSIADIIKLAADDPQIRRGLDIYRARERGESWGELEAQYGHPRQVLDGWKKKAFRALADRLG